MTAHENETYVCFTRSSIHSQLANPTYPYTYLLTLLKKTYQYIIEHNIICSLNLSLFFFN